MKGGSNPFRQQPFNEVIATGIMERLGISHVPYTLTWNKGAPYCICEDFVTKDTELVPAWRIIQTQKKSTVSLCISILLIAVNRSVQKMLYIFLTA